MNAEQAELTIAAPATVLRRILLTPLELADWYPGFLELSGEPVPRVGRGYKVRLPTDSGDTTSWDQLDYVAITDDRIDFLLTLENGFGATMMVEESTWTLADRGGSTVVQHSVSQEGPWARPRSRTFPGTAAFRLDRLAAHATAT